MSGGHAQCDVPRYQAGEEPIRLAANADYAGFRRVAEIPFNLIDEVRP
jgi:hypothetical protein